MFVDSWEAMALFSERSPRAGAEVLRGGTDEGLGWRTEMIEGGESAWARSREHGVARGALGTAVPYRRLAFACHPWQPVIRGGSSVLRGVELTQIAG